MRATVYDAVADTSPIVVLAVAVAFYLGLTIAWLISMIDTKSVP